MADTEDPRSSPGGAPPLLRHASDERLARLARKGNARAFAVLYERHHQPLYRLCLSIVRAPDDARDALQSTFERAFAALRASEREIAVRPWLFRIAHNESISVLRRRRPDHAPPDAELPSPATVEATVAERARLSLLVADIRSLPARQRSVLLMRELSGLSIAEIAAAMSMSSAAVKQTLFEARGSLHSYEEGRAMSCEDVRRAISDGDGRALRARKLRAHLRDCADCSEFRSLISAREADLRALAPPLPAAAAATMLADLLAHGAHAHAGVAAGSPALAAAKGGASSIALKGVAGLAIAGAIGAGAAHLASQPAARPHSPASSRARTTSHAGSARASGAGHAAREHLRAHPNASRSASASGRARSVVSPSAGAAEQAHEGARAAAPVRAHGAPSHARPARGRRAHGKPSTTHKETPRKPEPPRARSHPQSPTVPAPSGQEHPKRVPHAPSASEVSP